MRAAASQLAGSIDDVLDMAQIDAQEMGLNLGDVSVAFPAVDVLFNGAGFVHHGSVLPQILVRCG